MSENGPSQPKTDQKPPQNTRHSRASGKPVSATEYVHICVDLAVVFRHHEVSNFWMLAENGDSYSFDG